MYKAKILPLAKRDISEAAKWYNSKQKGLGMRFSSEVRSKVLSIQANPASYSIRYDEVRCSVLDVFPFMVHYTINEEESSVLIAAVLHTSMNPDNWQSR